MPIVKYSLGDGKELTPEEEEAAMLRIQEAAPRRLNFDSMEERARYMQNHGGATVSGTFAPSTNIVPIVVLRCFQFLLPILNYTQNSQFRQVIV